MVDSSDAEFDAYARWTAEAVRALGPACAIPAGCRGSGSPAVLAWLAEALQIRPEQRFLDVGAGVGGAAAWLAEHYSARVTCLEPMTGAVNACRSLFGLSAGVATAHALPIATGTVPDLWALGVLSTSSDHPALLSELRRVLKPGGGAGILVYAALELADDSFASGENFQAKASLPQLLADARLELVESCDATDLMAAPASWSDRVEEVEDWIAERHDQQAAWKTATDGASHISELLSGGQISPVLLHARAR
jgi:ubiquinone/menaquinone biosynthesis C-methylase UbiE